MLGIGQPCPTCGFISASDVPPRTTIQDPVQRVARRLVRLVERYPAGLFRSDFRRELGRRDRRWMDEAIEYAVEQMWMAVLVAYSPTSGRVTSRVFAIGASPTAQAARSNRHRSG